MIAVEHLYKYISVLWTREEPRIGNLYDTLQNCPRICERVRKFQVFATEEDIPIRTPIHSPGMPDGSSTLNRTETMAQVVAHVLGCMTRIEDLSIDVTELFRWLNDQDSMVYLFGNGAPMMATSLAQMPAFRTLKRLDWKSRDLPAAVACLPSLLDLI